MKQVYLKILFSLLMAVACLPALAYPWNPEDGYSDYDEKYKEECISIDGVRYHCSGSTASVVEGWSSNIVIHDSVEKDGKSYRVTCIEMYAFEGSLMSSVTIPPTITLIDCYAFEGCYHLKDVYISDLNAWCKIALYDNPLRYALNLYLGDELINDFVIPDGVTSIDNLVAGWKGLTSITIPDSVTEISHDAFRGCTGLTSVTIPDSVTEIGPCAFEGCTGLTSVTIPDSVTEIGISAFEGCTGLTSVTIPDSVTEILISAFEGCTGLTSVAIPDSVTEIMNSAFKGCTSLNSAFLGNSLTDIRIDLIFDGCNNLELLSLGNAVSKISGLFYSDIHTLICHTVVPPRISDVVFPDKEILPKTIYVPAESVKTYKYTLKWERYADSIMPIEASSADVMPDDDKDYTITGNIVSFDVEAGMPVNIYSIDGVLRYKGSGPAEVELPEGTYIIRCGSRTSKVIIR